MDDIDRSWTASTVGANGLLGTYRSPTDAPAVSALSTSLEGWRPLSATHAVIGRVAVEQSSISAGDQSVFIDPTPGSPFVPTDTNAPAVSRTQVTLEGGDAVRLGSWRVGLALAYQGTADHAVQSRIAVTRRSTDAGATLGIARTLGASTTIGLSVRRALRSETANLFADPGTVRVFPLDGYVSVTPEDHTIADAPFYRRADRTADSYGIDWAGNARGLRWSARAHRERTEESQIAVIATSTPATRWRTSGVEFGATAQRSLGAVIATAAADYETQRGTAERSTSTAAAFTADANRVTFHGDVRWLPSGRDWGIAAQSAVERAFQLAADRAARATTNITAWTSSAGAEFIWCARAARSWSAGITTSRYVPYADLPSPIGRGAAYQSLIAPVLELAAAPSISNAVALGMRSRQGELDVVARIAWSVTASAARAEDAAHLPGGTRSAWTIALTLLPASAR